MEGDPDEINFACHGAVGRIVGVGKPGAKGKRAVGCGVARDKAQCLGLGSRGLPVVATSRVTHWQGCNRGFVIGRDRVGNQRVADCGVAEEASEDGAAFTQGSRPGNGGKGDIDLDGIVIQRRILRRRIVKGSTRGSDIRW